MSRVTMNPLFDAWAARPEIETAAQQYIIDHSPKQDEATTHLNTIDWKRLGNTPAIKTRGMNFGILGAMNQLYWMHHGDKGLPGIGSRPDFNVLAMQDDEKEWRKVFAIFAWSIGFRPEGDLAPPADCTPQLRTHSC